MNAQTFFKFAAPLALLGLSACAAPFNAKVSRFQSMPAPQGESFAVVSGDPALSGGLEFSQYANLVAGKLEAQGYRRAAAPAQASLLVTVDYDVDKGRERIRSTPGSGFDRFGPYGWYSGFGYAPYYGFRRSRFVYGFHDPFLFGGGFGGYNDIESYTVYTSELDMKIERRNGERLFEGTARAMSRDDDLTYLVPNLVEAMFTGFPGNSGETVKITVAPPEKR